VQAANLIQRKDREIVGATRRRVEVEAEFGGVICRLDRGARGGAKEIAPVAGRRLLLVLEK